MFGGLAVFIAGEAMSEEGGAAIVFWLMAAAFAVAVVIGLGTLMRTLGPAREIVLTDTELSAPRAAWSGQTVVIPLASITRLRLQKVRSQRFLNVYHGGRKLTIGQALLPDRADFDELVAMLGKLVNTSRRH